MIDLRSDTLTQPSEEMLKTIFSAQLGDASRENSDGRGEDPTVNQLEDFAARLTGKEAAAFFPTGTLANTAALLTYCRPGDQVLVDEKQHILLNEKIAFESSFGQLLPIVFKLTSKGTPDQKDISRLLNTNNIKLLSIENTHNFAGGKCIPLEELKELKEISVAHRIPIHMDGARLFNASIAIGEDVKSICRNVNSVMFCLSKGLGAPAGSLLCGDREFIQKTKKLRKNLGGNMRQAGVLAAPGIYALEHNVERLIHDHSNAKYFAERLVGCKKIMIDQNIQSNIVIMNIAVSGITQEEFCNRLYQKGLQAAAISPEEVRVVFYKDIPNEQTKQAVEIVKQVNDEL